ncbi:MAG TPA: AraC family transcriptional regulator [Chryseolinea sp.]|nr:AraC family transcriptional regulator [Chryseolinea sp.]
MTDNGDLYKKEGFEGQRAIIIPRKILKERCQGHPLINSLFITDIGFYPKARGHFRERPHGCDQHILIYVASGCGHAEIKKEMFQINAGDFILLPAKTRHLYQSDEKNPWSIYWVHFSGRTSADILSTMLLHQSSYKGSVDAGMKRGNLFDELYVNLERGYGIENLIFVNMALPYFLSSFIFNSRYNQLQAEKDEDIFESSINFMQKNLHKALTLKEIAQSISLSSSHFSFLFKNKMGYSPIEYFNHLKIQKACQYLLFTHLRIKEISNNLGFEDQYYFSRMFSKLMGVPPVEYKKKRLT